MTMHFTQTTMDNIQDLLRTPLVGNQVRLIPETGVFYISRPENEFDGLAVLGTLKVSGEYYEIHIAGPSGRPPGSNE